MRNYLKWFLVLKMVPFQVHKSLRIYINLCLLVELAYSEEMQWWHGIIMTRPQLLAKNL